LVGDAEAHRLGACLGAGANSELVEDRGDVMLDRALGEHQCPGDLGVLPP
jgi:hypothetical protein